MTFVLRPSRQRPAFGVTALALLSLSGCKVPDYVEPAQGDLARVRFVTNAPSFSVLRSYDDAVCNAHEQEWMRFSFGQIANPKSNLGIALVQEGSSAQEFQVDATKPLTFAFMGGMQKDRAHHLCGVSFTYQFGKGRDYEVAYALTLPDDKTPSCAATVYEISSVAEGATATRTPVKTFNNLRTPENSVCLNRFLENRWL